MASQLVNLMRVLSWNDYPRQSSPAPGPNETKFGALTATMIKPSGWGVEPIPGTKLSRLRDSVTVTVEFVKEQSWVEDWVFTKPQGFQDDLLTHEQGHYKLAALLARDAFLAFMQLKSKQYAHSQDLQKDLNQITSNILSKAGRSIRSTRMKRKTGRLPTSRRSGADLSRPLSQLPRIRPKRRRTEQR